MANNKKPRKAHKPTRCRLPIMFRHNQDDERTLQLVPHQELDALRQGIGDKCSWNTITCRLNIGMTLAERHYNDEQRETISRAIDAVVDVKNNVQTRGKWAVSGDEFRLIGAGLTLTDDMQLKCTRRENRDAIDYVMHKAGVK